MENEKFKMVFPEFKDDWIGKHPGSIPIEEYEDSPYPRWAKPVILIGFILAALLSGVHTMVVVYDGIRLSALVDEIQRQWVARGSFIVYEIGLFAAAYLMGVQSTRRLAQLSAAIIFLTLIAVNLYSVDKVYGFDLLRDFSGSFVTGLFALVPVLAYSFSKLYINIGATERAIIKRGKDKFREDMKQLDAVILAAYKKYEKDFDRAARDTVSREDFMKFREIHQTSQDDMKSDEPRKPRVKLHEVARQIHEAGDTDLSVDEMMRKYGISQGSTSKIRDILRQQHGKGYTNGLGQGSPPMQ